MWLIQITTTQKFMQIHKKSEYHKQASRLLQPGQRQKQNHNRENKVSKFCMDAGFVHVVEIGQYFMTKDTEEQFFARACRENTLPRSDESSQPIGWIQGNTRIGPVIGNHDQFSVRQTWN